MPALALLSLFLLLLLLAPTRCRAAAAAQTVFETVIQYTTAVATASDPGPTTATATGPPSYETPALFQSVVLNSTNFYRRVHNASDVTWNHTLAEFAARVAAPCEFKHSGGPYGENLAAGYANATASIETWGHEGVDYPWNDPDFTEETGHFSQLVWKDTRTCGCAARFCNGTRGTPGWFVVCEYFPRGNTLGEFAQQVQSAISGTARVKVGRSWGLALVASVLGYLALS